MGQEVLEETQDGKGRIPESGKPRSVLSDHGSAFHAVESVAREKGLTEFEKYLLSNKITFITGTVDHPQTIGKIEKFFDVFEKKARFFSWVGGRFPEWYDCVRPLGAFDHSKLEAPVQMFYKEMGDRASFEGLEALTAGSDSMINTAHYHRKRLSNVVRVS